MSVPRLLFCLCCLAAPVSGCGPPAPAASGEAPADRVLRRQFAFAGRAFVQTVRQRSFPLDPRVERAASGMNDRPPGEDVSVVAIAQPRNAGERRWNEFVAGYAARLVREQYSGERNPLHPMNVAVTIELAAAGPGLLVASWESYSYWYGQAHGATSTGNLIWSLAEDRQLTADDILAPESGWTTALALPLTRRLIEPEPVERPVEGYTRLQRSQSPAISPDGLWLRFAEGGNERWWQGRSACLRWPELKPYLRKTLPFDLSRLRWRTPAASCSP